MPEFLGYKSILQGITDFAKDGTFENPTFAKVCFQREVVSRAYQVEIDRYTGAHQPANFIVGEENANVALTDIEKTVYEPKRIAASINVSERDMFAVAPGVDKYAPAAVTAMLIRAQELIRSLNKRLNIMAYHSLSTGKVLDQDGETVFDFKKNTGKLVKAGVDFTGANDPFKTLDDLFTVMVEEFNSTPAGVVLIMGTSAYTKFLGNKIVQEAINGRANVSLNRVSLDESSGTGLNYPVTVPINRGMINDEVPVITYTGTYKDKAGAMQSVVPKDAVILTTRDALQNNTQIYCAQNIRQTNGSYMQVVGKVAPALAGSLFDSKDYLVSRPMFIPHNVNGSALLTIA